MRTTDVGVIKVEVQKELKAGYVVPRSQVALYKELLTPSVGSWGHGRVVFPLSSFFSQTFFIFIYLFQLSSFIYSERKRERERE